MPKSSKQLESEIAEALASGPSSKPRKTKAAAETEQQRLAHVVDERVAAARYSFRHGLRENATDQSNLIAARGDLAHRIASDLGHSPFKLGISYDCRNCDATGTFDVEPIGDIFTTRCPQ